MNIEDFRNYCLLKNGATEEFPFGPETIVFKIGGKIFALAGIENFTSFNVKCDPEEAVLLREKYTSVLPGYHMNKKHWNTILTDENIPLPLIFKWIDQSYSLVINSLSIKEKKILKLI